MTQSPKETSEHESSEDDHTKPDRVAYKVAQAADAIGYSRYVLYGAIRRGELAVYQPYKGADWLILADDLRAWVTRRIVLPNGHES